MSSGQPGLQSITVPKDKHFKHHGIVPQHMKYKDMKGVEVTGCAQASPVLGMWGFQRAMERRGWDRRLWSGTLDLKRLYPSFLTGERTECSEGWPPSGGQHDPTGRQHTDGQGGDGDQTPRHGRGCPQERYFFTAVALAQSVEHWPGTHRAWVPSPELQKRAF